MTGEVSTTGSGILPSSSKRGRVKAKKRTKSEWVNKRMNKQMDDEINKWIKKLLQIWLIYHIFLSELGVSWSRIRWFSFCFDVTTNLQVMAHMCLSLIFTCIFCATHKLTLTDEGTRCPSAARWQTSVLLGDKQRPQFHPAVYSDKQICRNTLIPVRPHCGPSPPGLESLWS